MYARISCMLQADYTGKLTDGTVFDSSMNEGRSPLEFTVGVGQVIPGWDQVRKPLLRRAHVGIVMQYREIE